MWTLSEVRQKLTQRLAEEANVFWTAAERDSAINEAQRFIAAITNGVSTVVSGVIDKNFPYLTAPGKLLNMYEIAGWVAGPKLEALRAIPVASANLIDPGWVNRRGRPRWLLVNPAEKRLYFSPSPHDPIEVSARVSVLPDDMEDDSDPLFNGEQVMQKYQGALLNVAAALLLLKERYDGDAERFYAFAVNELTSLGVEPARIPERPGQQGGQ